MIAADRSAWRRGWRGQIALTLLALALYLPGFVSIPTIDRDEARYAQASRQMIESGDYVDIRFQETPRYKKPIGIYWLQSASVVAFADPTSRQIWPHRLPSILAALAAILLTARLGRILFGEDVGFAAGAILAATPLMLIQARMATTDAALLACCLLAMNGLAGLHKGGGGWRDPFFFWTGLALGILIKGPVAPLVAGATILTLILVERRWAWLRTLRPIAGLAWLMLLVLPWFVAIAARSGDAFFEQSFLQEFAKRLTEPQESHGAPPGYYLVVSALFFFPFSLPFLQGLTRFWSLRREASILFCIAWIIPLWIALELIATKLPHYALPFYPAAAILVGNSLFAATPHPPRLEVWRRWIDRFAAVVWWLTLVAVVIALAGWVYVVDGGPSVTALAAAALTAIAGAVAWRSLRHRQSWVALGAMIAISLTLSVLVLGRSLPQSTGFWLTRAIAAEANALPPCADRTIAAAGYHEPSLVFALGTATRLTDGAGAVELLKERGDCALAVVSDAALSSFQAAAERAGIAVTEVSRIEGFDYVHARHMAVALYRRP